MTTRRDPLIPLQDIVDTSEEIAGLIRGLERDDYLRDRKTQLAVGMCFVNLGAALNRLKASSHAVAARIPDLQDNVDLRNILAHDYEVVAPAIVWRVARDELPELGRSAMSLMSEIDSEQRSPRTARDSSRPDSAGVQSAPSATQRDDTAPPSSLADDALVLSCAVSERVDASSSVHRATLRHDVEEVLQASDLARDVPRTEVEEIAAGIARKRAETDLRVAAAHEVGEGEYFEVMAQFEGDPGYTAKEDRQAYHAALARRRPGLYQKESLPTVIELRVARAVVATRDTDRHGLALAMADALERGTTSPADDIRKERETLLGQLQEGTKDLSELRERSVLRRVYRNFTGAEIHDLSEGRGPLLARLPGDKERVQIRDALQKLHSNVHYPEPSPWRARHDVVARAAGHEREGGHAAGRDRGDGAEIEI